MKTREELIEMHKPQGVWYDNPDFSLEELQQILSAPTNAQMECPYCHETAGLKERLLGNGIIYDTGYKEIEFFDFDNSKKYSVKIHFCPICGRKLGE